MKKILILGSGLVSRPGVRYLLNQKNIFITVASNELNKAKELINGKPNSKVIEIDVENINDLAKVIKESDIVVSLLPWTYHIKVAEQCLEFGKHLVTASYCSETMQKLDEQAKRKNLLFLNELGLDPGIDRPHP